MHPVACVSNTGRTSVLYKVFFSARFYCALLTLHVSAPFSGHLRIQGSHLLNGSVEYIVTALDIFFCVYKPPEDGH
jgi:hypothetical protein